LPPNDASGLIDASHILKKVEGIDFIFFNEEDVVRHKLVKEIIKAYGKSSEKNSK
jgi:phosphate starvation-inducible PhoH-like protein